MEFIYSAGFGHVSWTLVFCVHADSCSHFVCTVGSGYVTPHQKIPTTRLCLKRDRVDSTGAKADDLLRKLMQRTMICSQQLVKGTF